MVKTEAYPGDLYMQHPSRMNRVIVLEEMNFVWDRSELTQMARMWRQGTSVEDIADEFDRDPDEVVLALMHLARNGRINQRKGGLFANMQS